ncbi:MAG: UDP-N-acetylglucosamine 1-carboxyvinyltransferase [Puniceicoccales bacterium]|jgi:UDP-N-acetylglucosamine 1-carboxyvinyltransferase|nr:UDP-N-acetylglucosamine 1-carboxyvinyltransferase [Puniceicoccales bacterium]
MNCQVPYWEALIEGRVPLRGKVAVNGSKNTSFPILAASLLTSEPCLLQNVPQLWDTEVMRSLLRSLGSDVQIQGEDSLRLQSRATGTGENYLPDSEGIQKIRGSIYLMGALLASQGYVEMPFPGGCNFGERPIDLHLRGFEGLGAKIERLKDRVILTIPKEGLKGTTLFLGGPAGASVTGTANVLLAAVKAKGHTRIECAACEPEVTELCRVLLTMGARIRGIGSPILEIEGVDTLNGFSHRLSPDRIEAGTWALLGLCTGHPSEPMLIEPFPHEELGALLFILHGMGAAWKLDGDCLQICGGQKLRATEVHAIPYPGFPTDLQAPLAVLMSLAEGESSIHDHIYSQRFLYARELKRLGASCEPFLGGLKMRTSSLRGTRVEATDLRAAAALYIAGLMADGISQITHAEYVDRGYEHFEEKLRHLGAHVERRAPG